MMNLLQRRNQIVDALTQAGFSKTLPFAAQSILDAKIEAGIQRQMRYFNYEEGGFSAQPKRRRGIMGRPSEEKFRFYLYATVVRAWVAEFGEPPKVHKNNFGRHPFAQLIKTLFYPQGNTKLQRHLEKFFAYRNRQIKQHCIFVQKP